MKAVVGHGWLESVMLASNWDAHHARFCCGATLALPIIPAVHRGPGRNCAHVRFLAQISSVLSPPNIE
jgi:hypothetical protein